MKFNEFVYERPDFETEKNHILQLIESFQTATSAQKQIDLIIEANEKRSAIQSMATISSIRNSIDTQDKFYEEENQFWDQHMPYLEELSAKLYQSILSSPYLNEIKPHFPETFFKIAEYSLKAFDPSIIEHLQKENALSTEYTKLLASAQIEFDGNTYTLTQLTPWIQNKDRSVRQRALEAKMGFFETHEETLDRIYSDLVSVRTEMAQKLGYKNFVELGYIRMMRFDYNEEMVANYRRQVLNDLVPVAQTLYEKQRVRIGLDSLKHYDLPFQFKDGNAKPYGTPEEIIEAGQKMYHELSEETKEFIDFMMEHELMDLVSKKGKAGGGYCTYIPSHKSPFIFSNFNGTSGDIDVLTHEAGHAFQVYSSSSIETIECQFPTMESAEIHSMSMEFFTWPWMESFFKEQAQKYRYSHLAGALKFIPYGVLVDHFQHIVYNNPDKDAQFRKEQWRILEKQYLPHIDYSDSSFLEKGTYWYQQGHIFQAPFYYIDYTLAQVIALQFFKRMQDQDPQAWKDYLHLCQLGGTKTFLQLVKEANLKSPFEDGVLKSVMKTVENWLDSIDDLAL